MNTIRKQTLPSPASTAGRMKKALMLAALMAFTILSVKPKRIFTPNGDGVNDLFKICIDNPADSVVSLAKVYSITGAEAGDLKEVVSGSDAACPNFLYWDGRDTDGRKARGGIYLYKIDVEQKVFTGSLVLAR